jgi:predicted Zn finger-like uncharacterized protein
MNVTCPACSSKYAVPDEKVLGKKVRIRCKRCGESILVDGTAESTAGPVASQVGALPSGGSAQSAFTAAPATISAAKRANLKRTMVGGLRLLHHQV